MYLVAANVVLFLLNEIYLKIEANAVVSMCTVCYCVVCSHFLNLK